MLSCAWFGNCGTGIEDEILLESPPTTEEYCQVRHVADMDGCGVDIVSGITTR